MSAHDDYLDPDRAGLNDEHQDNDHVKEAFGDYDGPGQLYRSAYKYTACGPGIGITFTEWVTETVIEPVYEPRGDDWVQTGTQEVGDSRQVSKTWYCDDLYKLGTWASMDKRGRLITRFEVSSIVEGVEQCTDTIEVPALAEDLEGLVQGEESISEALHRLFWEAVSEVDKQADDIWNETHGCETCATHFGLDLDSVGGECPVWNECPVCGGDGIVI